MWPQREVCPWFLSEDGRMEGAPLPRMGSWSLHTGAQAGRSQVQLRLTGWEGPPGCHLPPAPSPGHPSPSLPRSSGSTASGWRWWWTTGCPPRTGSCSSCIRLNAASSGVHCWRRPTPSKCLHPAPTSLPPAALHSGKDRNYSTTI